MKKTAILRSLMFGSILSLLSLVPAIAYSGETQGEMEMPAGLAKASPTPKPSNTPTPAPILFDDFKGESYDGPYDEKIWESDLDDEVCKIEKTKDGLFFAQEPSAKDNNCKIVTKEEWLLKDIAHIESRMKLTKAKGERAGYIEFVLTSEERDWWMSCHIGASNNDSPYLNCFTPLWETPPNPGGVGTAFNRWRSFRMDIDPETLTMKFSMDNLYYAKFTPPDAKTLKDDHFRIEIGLYTEGGVATEGVISHIKVWP